MKPSLRTPFALLCCFGVLLAAHAAPQNTGSKKGQPLGQFLLNNDGGTLELDFQPDKGTVIVLSGKNLSVTSSRYDIAAPKIVLYGKKTAPKQGEKTTAKNPASNLTNADATGGVRIAVRNPEEQQDTVMTADSAKYVGPTPGVNAFIYATGNVHTVTRTPQLASSGPLVTDSRKATIELFPEGGYNIKFDGIQGSATPLEKPAPAAKGKP